MLAIYELGGELPRDRRPVVPRSEEFHAPFAIRKVPRYHRSCLKPADAPALRFDLPEFPMRRQTALLVFALLPLVPLIGGTGNARACMADAKAEYAMVIQPILKKHCLTCHSTKLKKGSLDLERFTSLDQARKDLKPWQHLIEQLEAEQMPPKEKPQPTAEERKLVIAWARGFLDAEARARAGDPGYVPLRRLSNTEYDCTIRDLTGVDLRPTREFPADGAAGEGFTNAAEALSDISPTLLNKYLNAAKDIADHAVLLPDGFRFSPTKTRRDWTNESTGRLRQFYADYAANEGRLQVQPYLAAAIRHRAALLAGTITPEDVAAKEKLNPKYFGVLWQTLTDKTPSYPLDAIRAHWRTATDKDVPSLAGEVAAWQTALWKTARVGSYVRPEGKGFVENTTRQIAADPPAAVSVPLRVSVKPAPDQKEVVLYLAARELTPAGGGNVVWHRPRFEAAGKPLLLLRDSGQLAKDRFGTPPGGKPVDEASLVAVADTVTEVRLPAALFAGREFVVEGRLAGAPGDRVVQFRVLTASTPGADATRLADNSLGQRQSGVGVAEQRGLQAPPPGVRRLPPCVSAVPLLSLGHPDRRGRVPEDVPPRGRTARPAVSRQRTAATP